MSQQATVSNAEIMEKLCEIASLLSLLTEKKEKKVSKVLKSYTCDYCEKDTYLDSKGNEKKLSRRCRLQGCSHGFCRPCLVSHFQETDTGKCPVEDCAGFLPEQKMEELKNPGAKGRKIAQQKKKEVPKEEPKKKIVKKQLEISSPEETDDDLNDLADEIESAF